MAASLLEKSSILSLGVGNGFSGIIATDSDSLTVDKTDGSV